MIDTLAAVLFFTGACVGHVALLVRFHNWCYGQALPRRVTDVLQVLCGLATLAGLAAFWLAGPDLRPLLIAEDVTPLGRIFGVYAAVCWPVGFLVLPAVTVARLRRRCPSLAHNHTETVDVAARLGARPVGHGKKRLLALLPYNECLTVNLSERTLLLPRLPPEWDGLTVLHLSDLHFCGTPSAAYFEYILDRCREWSPDLVAFTGDLADGAEYLEWVEPVLGRLHWREAGFAILGNHDFWYEPEEARERLRRVGLRVLGNGWEQIEVRGRPLVVIGQEGPWRRPEPDLSACPEGVFRLCLSHTPDNIAWARRHRIDLMLSGHVHGGQIRFPLLGSMLVPSAYGRKYDCGVFEEGPTLLHVSRGIGGEHPLRYNCRPEVTLLVLRRPPAETAPLQGSRLTSA
jgi:uncharacterized protein